MDDVRTCGRGLAEHAALPAKLAELTAALAKNLEVHQGTLDLSDENARREYDAYVKLAHEHRAIAAQLDATARHMVAHRELPMGRHDPAALADPKGVDAFATFLRIERELFTLLRASLERDETMLAEFRRGGAE